MSRKGLETRPKPGSERARWRRGYPATASATGEPLAELLATFGGGELKIRSHVGYLDLHALALAADVVLPRALDELAGNEDPNPLLEGVRCVLGDRSSPLNEMGIVVRTRDPCG